MTVVRGAATVAAVPSAPVEFISRYGLTRASPARKRPADAGEAVGASSRYSLCVDRRPTVATFI